MLLEYIQLTEWASQWLLQWAWRCQVEARRSSVNFMCYFRENQTAPL